MTALDISFDKNRDGVLKALDAGAEVFYVDHHFAGEIPQSDRLTTIIDTDCSFFGTTITISDPRNGDPEPAGDPSE